MGIYRRTLAYYRPFLGETVVALALGLVVTAFSLLKPWPFKYIVDGLLSPPGETTATTQEQLHYWFGAASPPTVLLFLCLSFSALLSVEGATDTLG